MRDMITLGYRYVGRSRSNSAREIVMLAVLTGLTVLGNLLSFAFLPIQAGTSMVIISGIAMGPIAGAIVGALARLIVNFYLGQGIHTLYQMVGWAILGFLAGVVYKKIQLNNFTLVIFTFLSVFIIYGGLMNGCTYLFSRYMLGVEAGVDSLEAIYVAGISYDLIHAAKASVFMFFFGKTIIWRLHRIKIKYGFYRKR